MAAFDTKSLEKMLKGIKGVGSDTKAQTKSQKEITKLQGKLQRQLAEQQAQYARELAAQEAQARLQAQREEQGFRSPFMEAELTGYYNGRATVPIHQLEENRRQFNQEFAEQGRQFNQRFGEEQRQFNVENELEQRRFGLENEIQKGRLDLDRLSQEQNNAIARGQLDLAREIETRKVALEERELQLQNELQTAELSGYMQNGQLTEGARAARAREGLEGTQLMGVDAQGRLTDASQQWRTGAGLEAARTNAQLGMQAADYFEAAAYNRDPNVQGALAFLNNPAGQGSSMGFRSAAGGTPETNSIQNLQGGPAVNPALEREYAMQANRVANPQQNVPGAGGPQEGPSPSLAGAQAAAAGQPAAFTSAMNQNTADLNNPNGGGRFLPERGGGLPMPGAGDPRMAQEGGGMNLADMNSPGSAYTGQVTGDPRMGDVKANAQMETGRYLPERGGGLPGMTPTGSVKEGGGNLQAAFGAERGRMPITPTTPTGAPQQPAVMGSMKFYNQNATMQPQDEAQRRLEQIQRQVIQPGAHRLAPGTMEAWSPTEKGLITSALKASGMNPQDFEQQYQRSKLQTGASALAI